MIDSMIDFDKLYDLIMHGVGIYKKENSFGVLSAVSVVLGITTNDYQTTNYHGEKGKRRRQNILDYDAQDTEDKRLLAYAVFDSRFEGKGLKHAIAATIYNAVKFNQNTAINSATLVEEFRRTTDNPSGLGGRTYAADVYVPYIASILQDDSARSQIDEDALTDLIIYLNNTKASKGIEMNKMP